MRVLLLIVFLFSICWVVSCKNESVETKIRTILRTLDKLEERIGDETKNYEQKVSTKTKVLSDTHSLTAAALQNASKQQKLLGAKYIDRTEQEATVLSAKKHARKTNKAFKSARKSLKSTLVSYRSHLNNSKQELALINLLRQNLKRLEEERASNIKKAKPQRTAVKKTKRPNKKSKTSKKAIQSKKSKKAKKRCIVPASHKKIVKHVRKATKKLRKHVSKPKKESKAVRKQLRNSVQRIIINLENASRPEGQKIEISVIQGKLKEAKDQVKDLKKKNRTFRRLAKSYKKTRKNLSKKLRNQTKHNARVIVKLYKSMKEYKKQIKALSI